VVLAAQGGQVVRAGLDVVGGQPELQGGPHQVQQRHHHEGGPPGARAQGLIHS
jgi:hypothetical protein